MSGILHLSLPELEAGLDSIRRSPKDAGRLDLIVRRPDIGQREILDIGELDVRLGLVGDTWSTRSSSRTADGSAHPDMQLNIMNSRVIQLITQDRSRWQWAGDQLFLDLDLSDENLPPGTRIALGSAIVEVTDQPHTGCKKFVERFGADAMRFVNSPLGRQLHLRGINARVAQPGTLRVGDIARKLPASPSSKAAEPAFFGPLRRLTGATIVAIIGGMKKSLVILALALLAGFVVLVVLRSRPDEPVASSVSKASSPAVPPSAAAAEEEANPGFLYGRITAVGGVTYEGRLRWGGTQEAFWGEYFNGAKAENPWAAYLPPERQPKKRRGISIFGIEVGGQDGRADLGRLFMARFGDIARIEAHGRDVRVTLKSGTVFDLDRFGASDFDDGVRVWDARHGVVDLDSLKIRTIELLPAPAPGAAPDRLYGTVRTRKGDFTGFVQWNREKGVGTDELAGRTDGGKRSVRFDTVRSIARRSRDSSLVTLLDGREIVLSGTSDVSHDNRGIYVDDRRYGRVLISWDAYQRIDFSPGGAGPAYGDFPPGSPLKGSVTTRDGRRLAGRLVFDLDESETIETLDAPSQGVDYTIPFGLIASIVPAGGDAQSARVTLHSGEEVQLYPNGDVGQGNAGLLIFAGSGQRPEYVPWSDVGQIDFERPPAMYPPFDGR